MGLLFYQAYAIVKVLSSEKTNMIHPTNTGEHFIPSPPKPEQPSEYKDIFASAYEHELGSEADIDELKAIFDTDNVPKPPEAGDEVYIRRGSSGRVEKWRLSDRIDESTGRHIAENIEPTEFNGEIVDNVEKPIGNTTITVEAQRELAEAFKAQQEAGARDELVSSARNDVAQILGEAPAAAPVAEVITGKEKDPVLAKLFAPSIRPELPSSTDSYLGLFAKTQEEYQEHMAKVAEEDRKNQPIIEARKNYDRITNQDTREYSEQKLIAAFRNDPQIRDILSAKGFSEPSLEAVDALREDPELRYEVGEYLLNKLDDMIARDLSAGGNSFGDRIVRNGTKRTDYIAMPVQTTSREYVAYLALAKLSGMFNYKVDSSDVFKDQDEMGNIIINQHRHATDMLV